MSKHISVSFAMTTLLLGGTLLANGLTSRRIPQPLALPLEQIDSNILGWSAASEATLPAETLKSLDATEYLLRNYRKTNQDLELFVAFYAQQRAGESMHSPQHCLPGAGWEIWQQQTVPVVVNGSEVRINQDRIENLGSRKLMFYWYQSASRIVASEYTGKLLLARDTLISGRTAGSIVRITLPDTPEAAAEGREFAAKLIPAVWRSFGRE